MYKGFEVAISLVQLENLRRLDSNQGKVSEAGNAGSPARLCCLEGLTKNVFSRRARGSH